MGVVPLPAAVLGGPQQPPQRDAQRQIPVRQMDALPVQRDGPVRQTELVVRKGDVVPCEALDLLPGQPLPPGQAEDQSRSCFFCSASRRLIAASSGRLMAFFPTVVSSMPGARSGKPNVTPSVHTA